ncbi:MAG: MFS transporter [Chloroflexota bacterium]
MLIGGIVLGLLLGLLLGGRLENLANIRMRFLPLLFVAVIVRFGTEALLGVGVGVVETFRMPLLAAAYGLLLFTLWHNRSYPGLALAFIGIASNGIAIMVNGGRMPVWDQAFVASGLPGGISSVLHFELSTGSTTEFLLHLGPLGDIIPIPLPIVRNVASIGDIFLSSGLAFFLFATLLRPAQAPLVAADNETDSIAYRARTGATRLPRPDGLTDDIGQGLRPGTGLSPSLNDSMALERPLMMGASGMGLAASPGVMAPSRTGIALPDLVLKRFDLDRIRRHPYIRLALNGSFSALWVGQVISLFGDRINQIALAALVYEITSSPLAVALAFFSGMIPNLVLSPLAGAYVDRWDQKQVLVVSDILRASLVLLVPVAILINVWLAYPLVFGITTISIFFRPARASVLPRVVAEDDLMAANSATWVGEQLADVVTYPLAGLFVVFLAGSLPLAFWFDAASYLLSAALVATIAVPPLVRRLRGPAEAGDAGDADADADADAGADADADAGEVPETPASVLADLKAGWAFLRNESVLLANTLQGTAGQFSLGILTVTTLILAKEITAEPGDAYRGTYAFMETAIGVGSLVGGFVLGALAPRTNKGRMVIAAYTSFGVLAMLMGIVHNVPLVLFFMFLGGIANMAFVIPSQTMFQERTPPELMGRVVSFRFSLAFGGMSIAMAVGGLLGGIVGPSAVIIFAGVISAVAGLAGLAFKEVREA